MTRFVHLQNSRFSSTRPRSRRSVSSHGKTPDSIGAKLLLATTALRAYRNRHLGTLMRCCEAWKPIEDCFDMSSFECIDFQRLSQIIADLSREHLEEREAEITNLPWTQTGKTLLQPDAEVDNVFGATRNLCYLSVLSQMKRAIPWKMRMNLVEGFVNILEPFPSTCRRPEASPVRGHPTICSKSSRRYSLDH